MLTLEDFQKFKNPKEFLKILKSKLGKKRLSRILYDVQYEKELLLLHVELVNLQH